MWEIGGNHLYIESIDYQMVHYTSSKLYYMINNGSYCRRRFRWGIQLHTYCYSTSMRHYKLNKYLNRYIEHNWLNKLNIYLSWDIFQQHNLVYMSYHQEWNPRYTINIEWMMVLNNYYKLGYRIDMFLTLGLHIDRHYIPWYIFHCLSIHCYKYYKRVHPCR